MSRSELFNGALAGEVGLVSHACDAKHSKAAVLQLLSLQFIQKFVGLGSNVRRVPAEITRASLGLHGGSEDLNGSDSQNNLARNTKQVNNKT